ncbi:MAG: hypothetical protein HONBIEJF_02528 [Fimbriimonadaceae bacterium]|nr:hypothetical protein [Fimbriimonadaceae bacterium]
MSSLSPELLRPLFEKYSIQTFVETGSFRGDGILAALMAGVSEVLSCDIDEKMVETARSRFADDHRVAIYWGNSLAFLRACLPRVRGAALFWLDAHYPSHFHLSHLETPDTRFPVKQELEIIHTLREGGLSDVIMIDDIRVISSLDNPCWRPGEVSDYFRIDNLRIAELAEPFQATHKVTLELAQEGIMTISPLVDQQP